MFFNASAENVYCNITKNKINKQIATYIAFVVDDCDNIDDVVVVVVVSSQQSFRQQPC